VSPVELETRTEVSYPLIPLRAARNIPRLEAFSPDEARIYPIVAAPRDR